MFTKTQVIDLNRSAVCTSSYSRGFFFFIDMVFVLGFISTVMFVDDTHRSSLRRPIRRSNKEVVSFLFMLFVNKERKRVYFAQKNLTDFPYFVSFFQLRFSDLFQICCYEDASAIHPHPASLFVTLQLSVEHHFVTRLWSYRDRILSHLLLVPNCDISILQRRGCDSSSMWTITVAFGSRCFHIFVTIVE